jgi:DNA-binding NarL/FixJ family response regulator
LPTILIADDHAAIHSAIRAGFESYSGFVVCGEAENGADAIIKAQELRPDLIVLDLSMPVMNGIETAKALRQMLPTVPVFVLTAHYSKTAEEAALDVGIRAVFSKYQDLTLLILQARAVLRMV